MARIRGIKSLFVVHASQKNGLHFKRIPRTVGPSRIKFSYNMALVPIPRTTLDQLLTPSLPTAEQYMTYWGRTSRERYNFLFESFGVGFLGVFAAYFSSFVIGDFLATFLGMIAGFWVILAPELKAYQRNWELRGGRELVDPWSGDDGGLYGAYFFGCITQVRVVEDITHSSDQSFSLSEFEGYTMETDDLEQLTGTPYKLRLCLSDRRGDDDENGRDLQIHTRMCEEYIYLEEGMPACAVLLSTTAKFDRLAAMTDIMVPDGGPCWVGDYPYLDRAILERELMDDEYLWDIFRSEGRGQWDMNRLPKP